jgi:hypothetical protein
VLKTACSLVLVFRVLKIIFCFSAAHLPSSSDYKWLLLLRETRGGILIGKVLDLEKKGMQLHNFQFN